MGEFMKRKLFNKFLKIILVLLFGGMLMSLGACAGKDKPDKVFAKELTKSASYKVEGVMESYYDTGRKRNDFTVLYKNPGLIKVTIKPEGGNDKQIILKNNDGVYILIPAVNKNFKIQSDWPENASYPYLLQSLAKDIANDPEALTTEDENTFTIETKTKMHADAVPVKQKILFSKSTNLPTEVLIYDENDNLYIRTVFSNINLNYNISDDEFDLENSMTTVRIELGDGITYEGREIAYPRYCPEGIALITEKTTQNTERTEVLSIMIYGNEPGFTVIQEFVNDQEAMRYQEEEGDIVMVMGACAILKNNSVILFFNGIEYTVASDDLSVDELIKIVQSFMTDDEK
jgi:outer membrane lipoprotein-sorting protein